MPKVYHCLVICEIGAIPIVLTHSILVGMKVFSWCKELSTQEEAYKCRSIILLNESDQYLDQRIKPSPSFVAATAKSVRAMILLLQPVDPHECSKLLRKTPPACAPQTSSQERILHSFPLLKGSVTYLLDGMFRFRASES